VRRSSAYIITIFFLCYSCSTTTMASLSSDKRDAIQTALFKESYMNVFIAVVEIFHDQGYSIDQADEWLGRINTLWKEERVGLFSKKDIRRRMSIYLERIDTKTTQVRLKCLIQVRGESGWKDAEDDMRVFEAKKLYRRFFSLIKRKVEEHRWMK